ncbi:hypothetical protein BS78_06G164000 [Paspalum vaginatum]|nr:hypothetical protein BS78_06G164000 [Paspalum vaginatum]
MRRADAPAAAGKAPRLCCPLTADFPRRGWGERSGGRRCPGGVGFLPAMLRRRRLGCIEGAPGPFLNLDGAYSDASDGLLRLQRANDLCSTFQIEMTGWFLMGTFALLFASRLPEAAPPVHASRVDVLYRSRHGEQLIGASLLPAILSSLRLGHLLIRDVVGSWTQKVALCFLHRNPNMLPLQPRRYHSRIRSRMGGGGGWPTEVPRPTAGALRDESTQNPEDGFADVKLLEDRLKELDLIMQRTQARVAIDPSDMKLRRSISFQRSLKDECAMNLATLKKKLDAPEGEQPL